MEFCNIKPIRNGILLQYWEFLSMNFLKGQKFGPFLNSYSMCNWDSMNEWKHIGISLMLWYHEDTTV